MSKVTFSNKNNEFFTSLKNAVDEYFEKTGQKRQETGACFPRPSF
jgi:hypothetical protein